MQKTCLLCGAAIQQPAPRNSVVKCCEWCGSPLLFTHQESKLLSQCMCCGVLLSSSYKGLTVLTETGQPDISFGISHGVCDACSDALWRQHQLAKKRRVMVSCSS